MDGRPRTPPSEVGPNTYELGVGDGSIGGTATFLLDEAIELWRSRRVGQIDTAFGDSVRTEFADGAWRNGEVLLYIEDLSGLRPRAEVYVYEATGDADVVDFTVLLRALISRAVPRRVHL